MEFRRYALVLWRWGWLIALATMIAAVVSYGYTSRQPRIYRATTTIMVGGSLTDSPNPSISDFSTSMVLAQSYAQVARRQRVLEAAVKALNLNLPWPALATQVNATALPQTQLLQIQVISGDPQSAAVIADEVARQLILQSPTPDDRQLEERREFAQRQLVTLQQRINDAEDDVKRLENRLAVESTARGVQDLQGQINALQQKIANWQTTYASLLDSGARGGGRNRLSVVDPAVASPTPVSPNVPMSVAIAAAIGGALAVFGVLVVEYLDDSFKSSEDIQHRLKLPCLAGIAKLPGRRRSRASTLLAGKLDTPAAEAYRLLRINLQAASSPRAGALLVTSAVPGEGKTTVACNVAVALAQSGKRVLLVDGDVRRPAVHEVLDMTNDVGLTTLLTDERATVESVVRDGPAVGLKVLLSGPRLGHAADLLGSDLMRQRWAELRALADIVVVDSPSVLAVADTGTLGLLCGEALLVLRAGRTRNEIVRRALTTLDQLGLAVVGVALNGVSAARSGYFHYYSPSSVASEGATLRSRMASLTGLFGLWR